jgi:hypothetical protein
MNSLLLLGFASFALSLFLTPFVLNQTLRMVAGDVSLISLLRCGIE